MVLALVLWRRIARRRGIARSTRALAAAVLATTACAAPLAASAAHAKVSARMGFASLLLTAGHQRFLLVGRDQAFYLLMSLLVNLSHLLVFLLSSE